MRSCFLFGLWMSCSLLLGCGSSHESLAANAIDTLKEIADVLARIRDPKSADAAKPQLQMLGERWRNNEMRRKSEKPPSPREITRLEKSYGPQMDAAMKRYLAEVARVQRIDGGNVALGELGEVKRNPGGGP